MAVQIQSRRDTAANWTANDPTLAAGEIGIETDTAKVKVGDGATAWTALDYIDSAIDHDATTNFAANEHFTEASISHLNITNIGTQTHAQLETAVGLNTAKDTNVSTDLSAGTRAPTTIDVNSSDGTNATLVEADTTNAGILGSDKWDEIVANTLKDTDVDHNVTTNLSLGTKAATTMDVNSSDGTNATLIEADTTNAGLLGSDKWDEIVANTTAKHTQDTDTALGSGCVADEHGTAATDQVVNVCYGTGDPPAANTMTEGALWVKHEA